MSSIEGVFILGRMSKNRIPLFIDHDGSADDLIALIAMFGFKQFRPLGIAITDGAGEISTSIDLTLRILQRYQSDRVMVARSDVKSDHPFPQLWREESRHYTSIACLAECQPDYSQVSPLDGPDFLAQCLLEESSKSVILLTGPATNLVKALTKYPGLEDKIRQVVWMAGAFKCEGNVIAPDHDGSAEWNIFWDPMAARKLIRWGLNLTMVPLDACVMVPADRYFMFRLEQFVDSSRCRLVFELLKMMNLQHRELYVFDLVAAACLGLPELATLSSALIDIELRGTSTGNIYSSETGSRVEYVSQIDEELFYEFVVDSLLK